MRLPHGKNLFIVNRTFSRKIALLGTLVLAASYQTPTTAALASDGSSIEAAVEAVKTADPTLAPESISLSGLADSGTGIVESGEVEIKLSDKLANEIEVSPGNGADIAVELPFSQGGEDGELSSDGFIVFDNQNGSKTVPIPREDGSLQINTVIDSADAPSSFSYTFSTPDGTEIRDEDGIVVFLDSNERMIGALAPAWAKDANGADVATYYKVKGSTVTQIVKHDERNAYPVVADPWLGIKLWRKITVDTYKKQPRVNLTMSNWGRLVWTGAAQGVAGFAAGQAILNKAGWTEANKWSPKVKRALSKKSQRQQYSCHALGSPFAGEWNLEKFRPNRSKHWSFGVAIHHCNWKTANRY